MNTVEEIRRTVLPILKKHGITRAGVFGSSARGTATSTSDIDLLVQFGQKISLLQYVAIKLEMEAVLGQKVDMVEYAALKPRLKKNILAEEVRIYG